MKIFLLLKKIRQKKGKSSLVPFSNPLFSLTNKPINQPTNKQQQKNPKTKQKIVFEFGVYSSKFEESTPNSCIFIYYLYI